ncbi:D-glucuronyl C5-epimerase family protein [Streptomyces wuyuanensis]|uniref:D-glucuronyl C5-epimerase family protein n=1 Tax=Streptomyces wuyuanensis TaxID=1196353 RepID=UPI0034282CF3
MAESGSTARDRSAPEGSTLDRRGFIRLAGGSALATALTGAGTGTGAAHAATGAPATTQPLPRASLPPLPPLPDQLSGGKVTPPAPSVRVPRADGKPAPAAVRAAIPDTLPFTFHGSGYTAVDLPERLRPWCDRPTPWSGVTPDTTHTYLDRDGVIMYRPRRSAPGYNQPVTQIQFGLGCAAAYRTVKDPARRALYLKRAKAQAKRLIDTRVEARGAWYFPYPFDFTHGTHSGISYRAPWYSGMAQGEAISLFVQLSLLDGVTPEERTLYRTAADGAFASLLRGDDADPWVVNRDDAGYLWIQEYPVDAPGTSDRTYNGMIFAMFGLWDYARLTGNPLAARLYDGACTTVDHYFPTLRNRRWASYYCLTHRIPTPSYHQHHINLYRQLHWQTGSPRFAHMSDLLTDDHPSGFLPEGSPVVLAAGKHTLYRYDTDADGDFVAAKGDAELARRTVGLSRTTRATANRRRRIMGRGVAYRIDSGPLKGWWVGEVYPKSYLLGEYLPTDYRPGRTLSFPAGSKVSCHRYGRDRGITATRSVTFGKPSGAPFDRRSVVNGRPMCRIAAGALKGYWVFAGDVVTDGR